MDLDPEGRHLGKLSELTLLASRKLGQRLLAVRLLVLCPLLPGEWLLARDQRSTPLGLPEGLLVEPAR